MRDTARFMIATARDAAACLGELTRSRAFLCAAGVLGLAVAGLLALHLAHAAGADDLSSMRGYAIDVDRSLPERFEYAMSFTAAVLMLLCCRATGQPVYACVAGAHGWMLVDNAFRLHEGVGWRLDAILSHRGDFPLGEALVFTAAALVIALSTWGALRRAPGRHRGLGAGLFAAAASMAVFAVGVDLLHAALLGAWRGSVLSLVLLEDGGELIIFALNTALALAAWATSRGRRSRGAVVRFGAARSG